VNVAFTQLAEGFLQLFAGVLIELVHVNVRDTGLHPKRILDALTRNLVANDVEGKRLVHAVAHHYDLHRSPARTFQHVRDFSGGKVVGLLIVDLGNHVTRADAALYAGEPLNGASTMVLPLRGCTVIPTP